MEVRIISGCTIYINGYKKENEKKNNRYQKRGFSLGFVSVRSASEIKTGKNKNKKQNRKHMLHERKAHHFPGYVTIDPKEQ